MKHIDYDEANKAISLLTKILRIAYYVTIIGIINLVISICKDLKVLSFVTKVFTVILPLIIGLFVAWLFNPLINYLCKNNFTRKTATAVVYIILIIILYFIMSMLVPVLNSQINELINSLPDIVKKISDWSINLTSKFDGLEGINFSEKMIAGINKTSDYLLTNMPNVLLSIIKNAFSFFGLLGAGLIIGFYLLINFDKTLANFSNLMCKCKNKDIMPLLRKINSQMYLYIKGTLLSASILFVVSMISFIIIGLKVPILFALFCAITNIIPFIGPYIGGIPAVLVAYSQSPSTGLLCLIVIVITQLIESNILTPIIMSKSMKLHPVTIMVSLLVFGAFGGIIGMLIAVPCVSILKMVYEYVMSKRKCKCGS